MTSDQINNIIRKYFFGKMSEESRDIVSRWLLSGSDETAKQEALHRMWTETNLDAAEESDIDKQLAAFHRRRDAYDRRRHHRLVALRIMKYVAVVLLPLLCVVATWHYSARYYSESAQMLECRVPDGSTRTLMLADGSRVMVNGGSSIVYPRGFTRWTERKVYVSGEVHFDVAHDASNPFVVNADGVRIKVLGTHFNVRAYADEPTITTTLEQGCVQVKNGRQTMVLKPNEQAVCMRSTGKLMKQRVSADNFKAWTGGALYFEEQPLSGILSAVSHKYGVRFEVDEAINLNQKCNMNFNASESIDDVLGVIAAVTENVGYSYKGKIVKLWKKKGGN